MFEGVLNGNGAAQRVADKDDLLVAGTAPDVAVQPFGVVGDGGAGPPFRVAGQGDCLRLREEGELLVPDAAPRAGAMDKDDFHCMTALDIAVIL